MVIQDENIHMRTDRRIMLNSRLDKCVASILGKDARIRSVSDWVFYYCNQCGAELFGYIEEIYKILPPRHAKETELFDENKPVVPDTCPICGGQHFTRNYISSIYELDKYHWEPENLFISAAQKRRLETDIDSVARISQIKQAATCSITVPAAFRIEKIKSDPEKLKDYVMHLIQIEGNIYAIERRLSELYFQKAENEKYVIFCNNRENLIATITEVEHRNAEKQCSMCESKIQQLSEFFGYSFNQPAEYPNEPQKPQLFDVGPFDFILGNAKRNKQLMDEYEKKMEEYRKKVARCDESNAKLKERAAEISAEIERLRGIITDIRAETDTRIANFTKNTPTPVLAQAIKSMLDQEIPQAEETLRKLAATRAELYGMNIVFSKYRDVVALSTFYEYLMAGRCTSLEGANGAYNLYETELRANLIIAKLSDIVEKLEEIKNNQYTIASLLENISSQMDSLNDTMRKAEDSLSKISKNTSRIAETSEVIAHNTAVTAYYSKVNAELTDAMGYLVAFN